MKKETRLLSIVLVSLLLVTLLAGIVAAQENTLAIDKLKEILSSLFGGDETYDYIGNILSPQILFGVLIFLIIFAIIDHISVFSSKKWLSVTVSIVIGILAAGFIESDWIKPLLNQYTALGVAITFLIPFVLLFYFMKEIAPHNLFVQKFVWWVFFIAVVVNLIINWDKTDSKITRGLYLVIGLFAIIMAIKGDAILKMLFREELHEAVDKYTELQEFIKAGETAKANAALYTLGPQLSASEKAKLQAQINSLSKK